MTLTEILKSCGIADDVIKAITDSMKINKVFTAAEENLDIRYGKLKQDNENTSLQLAQANKLIEELKKNTEGSENLQKQIADYETQISNLQSELANTRVSNALRMGLLENHVSDVDYLDFCIRKNLTAKGKQLELDESGAIKDFDEIMTDMKTAYPSMFENKEGADKNGLKVFEPQELKKGSNDTVVTKETFKGMSYAERLQLKTENEQLYNQLSK